MLLGPHLSIQGDLQRKLAARQARLVSSMRKTIRGVASRITNPLASPTSKPSSPSAGRQALGASPSGSRPVTPEVRKGGRAAAAAARVNGNGKGKAAIAAGGSNGLLPLSLALNLAKGIEVQQQQQPMNGDGKAVRKDREETPVGKVKELINVFGRR